MSGIYITVIIHLIAILDSHRLDCKANKSDNLVFYNTCIKLLENREPNPLDGITHNLEQLFANLGAQIERSDQILNYIKENPQDVPDVDNLLHQFKCIAAGLLHYMNPLTIGRLPQELYDDCCQVLEVDNLDAFLSSSSPIPTEVDVEEATKEKLGSINITQSPSSIGIETAVSSTQVSEFSDLENSTNNNNSDGSLILPEDSVYMANEEEEDIEFENTAINDDDEEEDLAPYMCYRTSGEEFENLIQLTPLAKPKPPAKVRPHSAPRLTSFQLPVNYYTHHTGFEPQPDFVCETGDMLIEKYEIVRLLGEAAFSKTYECIDHTDKKHVCIKVIKNEKDYVDQSLDEIKVLTELNKGDKQNHNHILRLFGYFYFKEHLFLVTELLYQNLYDFTCLLKKYHSRKQYFTLDRVKFITKQILEAMVYYHNLNVIHCDLKPENIMLEDPNRCTIQVIDFGSSCYNTDRLVSYVQSRSYRAPEVILGMSYDKRIDIWSLGCIVAELYTGNLLFDNSSVGALLASAVAILGQVPKSMLECGTAVNKYFAGPEYMMYEYSQESNGYTVYIPDKTSLSERLKVKDKMFISFLKSCLQWDPAKRPTAEQCLKHPWFNTQPTEESIYYIIVIFY